MTSSPSYTITCFSRVYSMYSPDEVMERKISTLITCAAVLRLLINLPTNNLFKFLKRSYSRSQVGELNCACKWRGKRIALVEKISFLTKCLDNSVLPHDIYRKVKKIRPRYAASIGRAFVKNELDTQQESLERVSRNFRNALQRVSCFLSYLDWI